MSETVCGTCGWDKRTLDFHDSGVGVATRRCPDCGLVRPLKQVSAGRWFGWAHQGVVQIGVGEGPGEATISVPRDLAGDIAKVIQGDAGSIEDEDRRMTAEAMVEGIVAFLEEA